jgi:two-component system response regulator YesN
MNTLLIVEDEKKIRQGIRAMALRSGVQVSRILECADGEQALEIIPKEPVDVMITDIRMPRMDGIALVQKMQSCRQVPLTIVLSGYDDFSYAVELMRSGVREYILKPVEREQLFAAIRKMDAEIEKRQAAREMTLQINRQQLKYLMLDREITPRELHVITEQFTGSFFREAYVVVCAAPPAGETAVDGILYLGNVEGMAVYLAESIKQGALVGERMQGPGTGVSRPRRELSEVRLAYEEAVKARRLAFAKCLPMAVYDGEDDPAAPVPEEAMERIVNLAEAGKHQEAVRHMEQVVHHVTAGLIGITEYASFAKTLSDRLEHLPGANKKDLTPVRLAFSHQHISGHLQAFIRCMQELHERMKSQEEVSRAREKMRVAITFMQENFHKDLNMAMVSNHVSMNYSQFSNAFKEYTGKNFVVYLKELRMARAKQLLRTTDMKVFEISWKVGYGNEKHFMKTFRAVCGVSPTEYRKEGMA